MISFSIFVNLIKPNDRRFTVIQTKSDIGIKIRINIYFTMSFSSNISPHSGQNFGGCVGSFIS